MKIAHILWGFTSGGIETMLVDIIAEQVKEASVQVFVINNKIEQALINKLDARCKVHLFKRKKGSRNIFPLLRLNWDLLLYNPDIIHYHFTSLVKLIFCNKPQVITIHNAYSSSNDFDKYNAIYAISEAVKEDIRSKGFNATTIENGIRIRDILTRNQNSVEGRRLRFVQIGRLYHPHKGQHIMLEAIRILVNEYNTTNFSFDFIGDGESNEYLHELVGKYHLQQYVNFLGTKSRDYIYSHLKDYDLCFQPSISEGFGLTIAEAMAAKVPVVVSNIPGTMEVIDNGKYGFFFESENARSLADKIMEVLPQLGHLKHIDDAWIFASQNYDISRTAKTYLKENEDVYNELLNKIRSGVVE